jgi:hypothetical protein
MSETNGNNTQFHKLETLLLTQPPDKFPHHDTENGELSYPEKYKELSRVLLPYHKKVEMGALLQSVYDWKDELNKKIEKLNEKVKKTAERSDCELSDRELSYEINNFKELVQQDPVIYLNQHGIGHVNKVIDKIDEILSFFKDIDKLTSFETFILLCAVQLHDIGNIFGRDEHEKNAHQIFMDVGKPIIQESFLKRLISKIVQVHGGRINGDKDTIAKSKLQTKTILLGQEVRECLIAALLRFGDELADDSSRADIQGLESNSIPDESKIYHEYSKSLHTVKIDRNDINNTLYLQLGYFLDFNTMINKYLKYGKKICLIDEIFYRTRKVEQERRYCMRFFSQYLHLHEIKVRIEIAAKYDIMDSEIIEYTLKETGYPLDVITINSLYDTGEKVLNNLREKGWEV